MRLLPLVLPHRLIAAVAVAAVVASASSASAYPLRSPQAAMNPASLQGYLNGLGQTVTVTTDQLDAQAFTSSASGNSEFTLMIELAGNAASNNIGIYNAGGPPAPPLYQLFPGAASAGWIAVAHFGPAPGALKVQLFDDTFTFQGQNIYGGVDKNNFGFYLQGPGGLFYSQDARNGGNVQVLTYAGTGQNANDLWECFEDLQVGAGSDQDYDDAVLEVQSIVPTPTASTSWGKIKARYR
jgi:hypothetical protein